MLVSAHKWLFQPKESALVLFRNHERAHEALSFRAGYLSEPNVGLLGSHEAVAIPLLATLMCWGCEGIAGRIDACMGAAELVADYINAHPRLELFERPYLNCLSLATS